MVRKICWWSLAFGLAASSARADEPEVVAGPLRFRAHRIDAFPGGYQVSVADLNGDGRPDVLGLSTNPAALAWYQNPAWTKHAISVDAKQLIDVAPLDADGDGRIDLALASDFNLRRSETGRLHFLTRGRSGETWTAREIAAEPTSHRLRWADVEGDGRRELVVVPIIGAGATEPAFAVPAPLALYRPPGWKRTVIDQAQHVVHGVRVVDWDARAGQELLTASFEGVNLFAWRDRRWQRTAIGAGDQTPGPKRGASEVALGQLGKGGRFVAAVEPWHGHQVVVYTPPAGKGLWRRRVIDDSLVDAHALATGDLDGDGRDEIVAGFRGKGWRLLLYRSPDGAAWERTVLDDGDMAASGVYLADLNQDGRLDIVAIGSASANLKWYESRKP
jgi:FG-GAP-like repeat